MCNIDTFNELPIRCCPAAEKGDSHEAAQLLKRAPHHAVPQLGTWGPVRVGYLIRSHVLFIREAVMRPDDQACAATFREKMNFTIDGLRPVCPTTGTRACSTCTRSTIPTTGTGVRVVHVRAVPYPNRHPPCGPVTVHVRVLRAPTRIVGLDCCLANSTC